MPENFEIQYIEKPNDVVWEVVGGGIRDFNKAHAGSDAATPLCVVLKAPGGEVVGGLIGDTYYEWLYINLMFVKDELRGKGFGQKIMALAEEEARRRGVKNIYLDTFSFQAPEFYEKLGYHVFGELKDFPPGHTRYFMTKKL